MAKTVGDQVHGKLQVKSKGSRMGNSDTIVPGGEVGYASRSPTPGKVVVFWPHMKREYKGDWRSGVHDLSELEITGKRGDRKDFAFHK